MKRIARTIAGSKNTWEWDNCKVKRPDISARSIETVLKPYADRLKEKEIYQCWTEAIRLAHGACVDELKVNDAVAYAVGCFKEQLADAMNDGTKP